MRPYETARDADETRRLTAEVRAAIDTAVAELIEDDQFARDVDLMRGRVLAVAYCKLGGRR